MKETRGFGIKRGRSVAGTLRCTQRMENYINKIGRYVAGFLLTAQYELFRSDQSEVDFP